MSMPGSLLTSRTANRLLHLVKKKLGQLVNSEQRGFSLLEVSAVARETLYTVFTNKQVIPNL